MRSIAGLSSKLLTTGIALALSITCAAANTLSEIQINAGENGYGIVLKTDEKAVVKKVVDSNNKMTLELKNTDISNSLNTVYNNVSGIENVTVQPASKNDVKITFKGSNVANSKVYFDSAKTVSTPVVNQNQESIELSAPVSSYTPVYNPETFEEPMEETQTANPQVNEILTKMHISRAMLVSAKKYTKKVIHKADSYGVNPITVIGILLIAAAFIFRPKKRSTPKTSGLGLSATQNRGNIEREIERNRSMASQVNNLVSRGAEPKGLNPASSAYGMRAYQQSQKNPYMSTNTASNGISGIPRRPIKVQAPIKKQTIKSQPVAPMRKNPAMQSSVAAKKTQIGHTPAAAQSQESELDSLKFLESITKIYEKNGRSDLAKGLKDNLRKAQLTKI